MLSTQSIVGNVLRVANRRSFLMHFVSKAWILYVRASKQGPCFAAVEEDEGDRRREELELACKADGLAPPDPV